MPYFDYKPLLNTNHTHKGRILENNRVKNIKTSNGKIVKFHISSWPKGAAKMPRTKNENEMSKLPILSSRRQ